jgi:hypothetical protein
LQDPRAHHAPSLAPGDTRLRLCVGLTAHRDLQPDEEPALRAAVRDFLQRLQRQFPALPLRLISALAEGGDSLVAEEALALGVELMVPLPMPQQEYERDFGDPASLARFHRLLARARIRHLPLASGNTLEAIHARGEARNRQYAQLGMFVSSHCQVLLALWDGNTSLATGGTAQVVDFHIRNVMPGLRVDEVAPNLLADDESDLVFHLSCSRRLGAGSLTPRLPPLHARWLTLAGAQPADGVVPQHYRHVFGQMEMFNRDFSRHHDASAHEPALFDASAPAPPPPVAADIARQFIAADALALHFRRRVRMSLAWTHTLAALMGVAFILYSDVAANRAYVALFLLLFGLGAMLNLLGRRRQWQRKYLDYRGLAEGLRVQLYWRLANVEIPPNNSLGYDSFLQKQDVDLSWIRHAMRGTGLLRDETSAADDAWLAWVVRHWIGDGQGNGGQLDYFRRGSEVRERAYRWTARLGQWALLAGLAGALALLVAGPRLASGAQQALMMAMGLLPLLAGIREAYSRKKADKELIKQFRFMQRLFASCRERLLLAGSDAETRALLLALGRACLEEHAEWILLHRDRPLDVSQLA